MKIDDLILNNYISGLKEYLEINPNYIGYSLSTAAEYGLTEMVKILLEQKADVHWENDKPLVQACSTGRMEIVKLLLEHKADVTVDSVIESACHEGHTEIAKLLVENKADVVQNGEPLKSACISGHLSTVKVLVELGAKVKGRYNSAVTLASYKRQNAVVLFLMENGADIRAIYHANREYYMELLKEKIVYKKWRKLYLRRWVRRVLTPLYYAPVFQGGIQAKKELLIELVK